MHRAGIHGQHISAIDPQQLQVFVTHSDSKFDLGSQ
jgi:hypothetical protein